jgi:hypothetical protein
MKKKKVYAEYREAKAGILTVKANIDRLLNIPGAGREREPERADL